MLSASYITIPNRGLTQAVQPGQEKLEQTGTPWPLMATVVTTIFPPHSPALNSTMPAKAQRLLESQAEKYVLWIAHSHEKNDDSLGYLVPSLAQENQLVRRTSKLCSTERTFSSTSYSTIQIYPYGASNSVCGSILGCFHFGVIVSNAAVSVCVQFYVSFLLGWYPGLESPGRMITLCDWFFCPCCVLFSCFLHAC